MKDPARFLSARRVWLSPDVDPAFSLTQGVQAVVEDLMSHVEAFDPRTFRLVIEPVEADNFTTQDWMQVRVAMTGVLRSDV